MTHYRIDLSFDGPAVAEGRMNVRDLAPAMLAAGALFESANKSLNGPDARVNVNVSATSAGSFHIVFEIIQDFDTQALRDLLATASDLKGFIFGGGTISLFALVKWLRGRKPKVEKINDEMWRLTVDDETYEVPLKLLRLYQDTAVRRAAADMVKPVKEEGIERLDVRERGDVIESVTKSDVADFDAPEVQDLILDETRTHAFSIISLAFKEGNKWRLTDGQATFSVVMNDRAFQRRVDNNEVTFAKGDVLVCDMRTVQWQVQDGVRIER